jgi:hypothetical protein
MATVKKVSDPVPLTAVLKQLASRRSELDQLDDDLASNIRRVEEALRKHVGVRIELDLSIGPEGDEIHTLVYGKHDGRWQLVYEISRAPEDVSATPLVSASRELRMTMFVGGHVDALIRSAQEQIEAQLKLRKQAIGAADTIEKALIEAAAIAEVDDDLPF